jgi:hypothetical protein
MVRMSWVVAAACLLAVGCGKKADDSSTDAGSAAASAAPAGAQNEVATFADMIPQSGTRRVLQPLTVRQAPDPNAAVLTRLSVGQLVDLKGSRGAWMMVMWPSGVGQLSPGWVDLSINDPRAANVERDAGATPSASASTKPAASGSRPIVRLPTRKK